MSGDRDRDRDRDLDLGPDELGIPTTLDGLRDELKHLRARKAARENLVEVGKTHLLWIDTDEDGTRDTGSNVREDLDTKGPTYIVTDPEDGQEYYCHITEAWTSHLEQQSPDEVLGIEDKRLEDAS